MFALCIAATDGVCQIAVNGREIVCLPLIDKHNSFVLVLLIEDNNGNGLDTE